MTSVHLLLELLRDPGIGADLLGAGSDPDAIGAEVIEAIHRLPRAGGPSVRAPAADRELLRAVSHARAHAQERGEELISCGDLLIALASRSGDAAAALVKYGATSGRLACRAAPSRHLNPAAVTNRWSE